MKKGFSITVLFLVAVMCFGISCTKERPSKVEAPSAAPKGSMTDEKAVKDSHESGQIAVARVNGVEIEVRSLVNEMNRITPHFVKPGQKADSATEEKIKKSALDLLIFHELAAQEAAKRGMKATPEETDRMMKDLKAGLKTEDNYKAYLSKAGITEEELHKNMEKQLLYSKIIKQEIMDKVKVDPQAVRKEYDGNKAAYKAPNGGQMTFEEARPIIEKKLAAPQAGKLVEQWAADLRKTAKIEIMLDSAGKSIHRAGR